MGTKATSKIKLLGIMVLKSYKTEANTRQTVLKKDFKCVELNYSIIDGNKSQCVNFSEIFIKEII